MSDEVPPSAHFTVPTGIVVGTDEVSESNVISPIGKASHSPSSGSRGEGGHGGGNCRRFVVMDCRIQQRMMCE